MSAIRHVVVIGAGIAGLSAALDCARVGIRVTVIEASSVLGGSIGSVELAGVRLDTGAESYARRGKAVRELVESLGLGEDTITPSTAGSWLRLSTGKAVPSPAAGILGIPSNPFAEDVRAVIGWSGAWRAYLDRIKPVLAIGEVHNLGELVERRMGTKVLTELVAPVTRGVYSTDPSEIDVTAAIPGLNAALTRTGSLSGAVLTLRGNAPAGALVSGLRGGMHRLIEALEEELLRREGVIIRQSPVTALDPRPGGGWSVRHGAPAPADEAEAESTLLEADYVIMAASESTARALLSPQLEALGTESKLSLDPIEIVSLVIDAPELDGAPRGSGVLIAEGSGVVAKALTHSSAKWGWIAEALSAHPGRHAIRLSYGRHGEPSPTAHLSDAELRRLAVADAASIFGVSLEESAVVDSARTTWTGTRPAAAIGRRQSADQIATAIRTLPDLDVTGAWLAGTGLAAVVPDALAAAGRIRHAVASYYLGTGVLPDAGTDTTPEAPGAHPAPGTSATTAESKE